MNEAITVKVISQSKADFEEVCEVLSKKYRVIATSSPIYDEVKRKWHIFLSVEKRGGGF